MNGFFGPNMVYSSVGLVWLLNLCPKTIFKGLFMLNKACHHQFHLWFSHLRYMWANILKFVNHQLNIDFQFNPK
jgi:hypothetical protein